MPSQEANGDNLAFFFLFFCFFLNFLHNNCMLSVHTTYNLMIK